MKETSFYVLCFVSTKCSFTFASFKLINLLQVGFGILIYLYLGKAGLNIYFYVIVYNDIHVLENYLPETAHTTQCCW